MFGDRPVPIIGTDPNLTGAPMGMGFMPQNLIAGPQHFVFFEDPLSELAQSTGAIIRQQIEFFEALTGCETENRYDVFLRTPMGLKYAFKCNEWSNSCYRCCCAPDCRPLQLNVRHIVSTNELNTGFSKVFARVNKPCKMACCCFCRPYMDVRLADTNQCLGLVRQPCSCCDLDTEIFDPSGILKYQIEGSCCQLGVCCCGGDFKKIANIRFDIKNNGSYVGLIQKLSSSLGEFFTKADSYQIDFPAFATPEEKLLIIICGLMIDYQFFEKDTSERYEPVYY